MSESLNKKSVLAGIVALLLLLSLLSMRQMRTASLWYDEVWSVKCAGGAQYGPSSLSDIFACVRQNESNPPGYHLILRAWGTVVGWSEFALWMLSMLTGLLTVACMYRLGRDMFADMGTPSAQVIGLSAAILLGMSAFFLQFFYELRVYVFIVLGTIGILWLYWRLVRHPNPALRTQVAFALATGVLWYLHFLMPLVFGAVDLYHLVMIKKNRAWWRVPLLMLTGSLLFLPWLPTLFSAVNVVAQAPTFQRGPAQMAQMAAYTFSNSNVALVAFLSLCALTVPVLKLRATRFVWWMFIVSLLAGMVMMALIPFVNRGRYLLYLWPLAALIVALGIEQLRQRRVNPALILLVWVVAGLWNYFSPTADNMDHNLRLPWRTLQSDLTAQALPGDVVLLFPTPIEPRFETLEYHYYTDGLPIRSLLADETPYRPQNDSYVTRAKQAITDAPRVWLGVLQETTQGDRLADVQRLVAADDAYCYTALDEPGLMRLELYSHKPSVPTLRFGEQVTRADVSLVEPLKVGADKTLRVLLSLSHSATLPGDTYSVGLHLEDAQGQLKAQSDFGLPAAADSCHLSTLSLKALPPGSYTLRAMVYEWRNGARLMGQTVATGLNADRPILDTLDLP